MSKDKIEIKHTPAILIGTPGRIADHFSNNRFSLKNIKSLILDEFDKSLEDGFEVEMRDIINQLPHINKRVLTSATKTLKVPDFVRLNLPTTINYLQEKIASKILCLYLSFFLKFLLKKKEVKLKKQLATSKKLVTMEVHILLLLLQQ